MWSNLAINAFWSVLHFTFSSKWYNKWSSSRITGRMISWYFHVWRLSVFTSVDFKMFMRWMNSYWKLQWKVASIAPLYSQEFNLIVLCAFQLYRNPLNILVVNLAVADILYATFIALQLVSKVTFTHPDGLTGTMFCKFFTYGCAAWIGAVSSVVTLVAISVERYYVVMYPHGNKRQLTKRKLKVRHWLILVIGY